MKTKLFTTLILAGLALLPSLASAASSSSEQAEVVARRGIVAYKTYYGTLQSVNWDHVIDPARLATDPVLGQGRSMVSTAQAALKAYAVTEQSVLRDAAVLAAHPDAKMQGLIASLPALDKFLRTDIKIEQQEVSGVACIVRVLSAHPKAWYVSGTTVMFRDRALQPRYVVCLNQVLDGVKAAKANAQFAKDNLRPLWPLLLKADPKMALGL